MTLASLKRKLKKPINIWNKLYKIKIELPRKSKIIWDFLKVNTLSKSLIVCLAVIFICALVIAIVVSNQSS